MCCRFYTDDTTKKDIIGLVASYDKKINWLREGDVHPGDPATVILKEGGGLFARDMKWGMAGKNASLLINARAESVQEKKTFSDSVKERRCVIPAKHFYEWDADKNRVQFSVEGEKSVYLAGIYEESGEETVFAVLTTAANDSMKPVHDRMPLVLSREEIAPWICEGGKTEEILKKVPAELTPYREYEQLSLF